MLAAVDLGSNSFRMVIARVVGDDLQLVDRLREGVRLAGALDEHKMLSPEGQERALACLAQFGQRLRGFPQGSVRAVGTNTLRKARNAAEFLHHAQRALGHRIEVVSGQEEARLIYVGVAHSLAGGDDNRLVVDIGGGSTECIIGQRYEPSYTASLYMGCVSHTFVYFPDGKLDRDSMRRAILAAQGEVQSIEEAYRQAGWSEAVGSSGTITAVASILRENGWSERGVTPRGLKKLRKAILKAGHIDDLSLDGLGKERARVLPGGVAILSAIFKSLGIERMLVSPGALREGLLYDLLGRIRHEDMRQRTIQRFVEQYSVDLAQAERVERTALRCLEPVAEAWELDLEESRLLLSWGARLHEIGLVVAHAGFHKHGAYLVANSDMPGFSAQDQRVLSLLIRGHRRKFPRDLFLDLPPQTAEQAKHLCFLLRLAVLLHRSRRGGPPFEVWTKKERLCLEFPTGWLEQNPLTQADLETEAEIAKAENVELRFGEAKPQ